MQAMPESLTAAFGSPLSEVSLGESPGLSGASHSRKGSTEGHLVENARPRRAAYTQMTREKIIEIKRALAGREEKRQSLRAIAAQVGVAYSTVYYIYAGVRHSEINTTPPITWYCPPVNNWSPKRRKAYKTRSQ